MSARARALPALILAVAFTGLSVTPAQASEPFAAPVVSTPDTSTTGHVTGTVTTDAPFVKLELVGASDPDAITTTTVPNGSPTSYDFETWGWSKARVRATACAAVDDCPGLETVTSVVNTTTVAPSVTFPTDTTIGTDNPTYTIEIEDTGGGFLQAHWGNSRVQIPHSGTIDLTPILGNGQGDMKIERCSSTYPGACLATGVKTTIQVWRTFSPVSGTGIGPVSPDSTTAPDGAATYTLGISGAAMTFDYDLRPVGSDTPARTGSLIATENGFSHRVALDLTGLADGTYFLEGTFSFLSPNYGTITGQAPSPVLVTIDGTAPVIQGIAFTRSTVYPQTDGYQDTVDFRAVGDGKDTTLAHATYDILNRAGDIVWTSQSSPPVGLTDDGGTWFPGNAPAGNYVVRATVRDSAGNTTIGTSAPVTVSQKKLTWVTATQTVTAKASLVRRTVGRCSTLRTPSLHGWAGSLGLYSATQCRTAGAASTVTTSHRLHLPTAFAYGNARITLNGAAARTKPRSTVTFGWRRLNLAWATQSVASATNTAHRGGSSAISGLRNASGDVVWGVVAKAGSRYDVRSFTVSFDYRALR